MALLLVHSDMFHFCFREIRLGQTAIVKTHILKEANQTGIAILTLSLISESAAKFRKKKISSSEV